MATKAQHLTVSDRVRVNEEVLPHENIGRMAVVLRAETNSEGERQCVIRVDRQPEEITLPERFLEKIEPRPSTLLASDLFLPWDMQDPRPRLKMFTESPWIKGRTLEGLLYYERIVIPTVDFAIIAPLVHWLGPLLLRDLLVADAISFVRYRGGFGYMGNGNGLHTFEIGAPDSEKEEYWVTAARNSPREAVLLQLRNRLKGVADKAIETIAELVGICTVDTALPEFTKRVEEQTYLDIIGSPLLSANYDDRADLKRLPGLDANQFRVFARLGAPAVVGDQIDITLRVGMLNLEAYLADEAGARDMVTDQGFMSLLNSKVGQSTSGQTAAESFARIRILEGVPDIVEGLTSGVIDPVKLWEFRQSGRARQFREWFDEHGPEDPNLLINEYGQALRGAGLLDSVPSKTVRFIVVSAASIGAAIVAPPAAWLASMGLSGVDSYLVSKIRLGFNPRYFIDDLNHKFFDD